MSDSLKHTIFTDTDCISEQTMFDYIDKKLSSKECHFVEKHLLHCELCSDALEGLELTKNRNKIAEINQKINERIVIPTDKKENRTIVFNYKVIMSIAATVLLLVGAVFFFNQVNKQSGTDNMAELKNILPPPPPPSSPPPSAPDDKAVSAPVTASSPALSNKNGGLEEKVESRLSGKVETKKESPGLSVAKPAQENNQTQQAVGSGVATNTVASAESTVQAEEMDAVVPAPKTSADTKDFEWRAENQKKGIDTDEKEKKEEKVTTLSYATSAPEASKAPVLMDISEKDDEGKAESSERATKLKKRDKANAPSEVTRRESAGAGSGNLAQGANAVSKKAAPQKVEAATEQEQAPQFPGGQEALQTFIHNNYNYTLINKQELQTSSKIIVQFMIDTQGNIKKPKIITGLNTEADKEALRVVGIMPKWKPATSDGKATSKQVTLPIPLQ